MLDVIGNIAGALIGKDSARNAAGLNRDMQREFAQKGIRWKVEDAKAAGLHPLAALGASTSSFAPVFQGDSLGQAIAQSGQDISRAQQATRTAQERREVEQAAAAQQAIANDRAGRVADSQIRLNDAQAQLALSEAHRRNFVGPPMPSGGDQGVAQSGVVVDPRYGASVSKPPDISTGRPGQPGLLSGPPSPLTRLYTFSHDGKNYNLRLPNTDIDALMENPISSAAIIYALNPEVGPLVIKGLIDSHTRQYGKWGREGRESHKRPFDLKWEHGGNPFKPWVGEIGEWMWDLRPQPKWR